MFPKLKERYRTIRLIREAIDTYPDGICFAAAGGRPILANRKMNEVCSRLTGHTVTNADAMWEELDRIKIDTLPADDRRKTGALPADDHRKTGALPADDRVKTYSFSANDSEASTEDIEQILCRLPDGNVWQFQRRTLPTATAQVTQYEASDITELYRYRRRLMENNARVAELHDRQRALLQNIVQNNVNKELLSAKVRIHDRFGGLLVMTKNTLTGDDKADDRPALFSAWENVVADMENASIGQSVKMPSPEKELRQIANMIGCQVDFIGEQPVERKATLLLYAAIREALTNAVRHADADKLTVQIDRKDSDYQVRISSNGKTDVTSIREGGGLSNLRRRLEQDGAAMDIGIDHGVVMTLTIPRE